jgi:type I restriction enzyme S subunit
MSDLLTGWAQTTIGALFTTVGGGTPARAVDTYWAGTIPWITSADISDRGDITVRRHITQDAVTKSATNVVPAGSTIVVTRVGLGKVALAPCEMAFSQDCQALLPVDGINPEFLRLQLSKTALSLRSVSRGTTISGVTKKQLLDLPLRIPPAAEQGRIVAAIEEHFSRLDAGVAAMERVRQSLRRMRAAVLRAAITGALVPDNASRWGKRQFSTLGNLDRGKSRHRPRNDPMLYGGPYPFIQTGDVAGAEPWIEQHTQTYSSLGLAQSRLWPSGTLCITIAANIAKTGLLTFDACFPDSVVGFIAHDGAVATRWVELVIRSMQDRLERLAPATAQKNINLALLRALEIPYPDLTYQAEVLDEYDRQMSLLGALDDTASVEGQRAGALRSSILSAAFSGKLVTQDPRDEPASALLRRIAAEQASSNDRPSAKARQRRRKVTT